MHKTPLSSNATSKQQEEYTIKRNKIIFIICLSAIVLWNWGIKRPIYQFLFGTPTKTELHISDNETYLNPPEFPTSKATIEGHEIEFKLLKQYYATGRVIYVDRYTNPFGRFYRDTDKGGGKRIYDEVVPQDITFVVGDLAKYPELKGSHAYRAGGLDWEDRTTRKIYYKHQHLYDTHLTNIHTIAASTNVQKGLDILKAGDIATLEGYLIYWSARLKTGHIMDFKSAVYAGEKHTKLIYGGAKGAGLCKQLLLTKITFDGYTFE